MRHISIYLLGATALGLVSAPALAQETNDPGQPAVAADADLNKNSVTVGVGAATVPSYEGSDHNRFIPAALARGTIDGFAFSTQGTRLYVDAIRNNPGPVIDIQLGPVVGINLNRTHRKSIDDDQVEALGTIKTGIEIGGYVGIGKTGVITSDYDKLTVNVSYLHDVNNASDSYIITPGVSYGTPLSRKAYVGLSADANYVGRGYANTYFGVTPSGSLASGLPAFTLGRGWKNVSVSGLATYALKGDLLHGIGIGAGISYSRLLYDFADSPIVSVAGKRNQLYGALGLTYTF